jgi:mono/diheme cytochrome c family protein
MRLRRSAVLAAAIVAVLAAAAAGLGGFALTREAPVVLDPTDTALVALGASVYATQCAACHGANLEGEADWRTRKPNGRLPAPPHDASGHTWHHPDAQLFALTKYGLPDEIGGVPYESDMPAYEGILTDREIIAVLSYIKSRWPREVVERHDAINARVR